MELLQVIDLNNLHKYSNIDVLELNIDFSTSQAIAKLDYDKFTQFIDIFKDISQLFKNYDHLAVGDLILCILHNNNFYIDFDMNHYLMIHLKLLHKEFVTCLFDQPTSLINYSLYISIKLYIAKYYDTITNLFRLTNSDDIQICNLNDDSFDTFNVLLLICKTRVLPKYIILHKILFFYLC